SEPGISRSSGHTELAKQLAGERLNHFQLLEYVGGGGMGAVFRALDTMLNRDVALKVLSRDQGAEEETRRRFQNEAQSAARLDHENIARVYYVGEDRGLNYIAFEFIEGTNLRDLVERSGPLALPEALSCTLQVAQALEHASSRDVVHRDIKPSNVIITAGGRAKLVDMGLARLHQAHPEGQDLTASGVTLGTFDYISPEQARDPRGADVRSDIYSLGCTLYYMLTGRPPFPDGTVLQKLLQHNSDVPPDPRDLDPSLPPGVSLLVAKMLAKDPLRRYQRPDDLVADLLLLAEQSGCVLPATERQGWPVPAAGSRPSPSLARHLPWLVPVSLLFLAAAVIDGALPWGGADDELAVVERLRARAQRPVSDSARRSRPDATAAESGAVQPAAER
ncbi:MAG: serine/threonine-protein kinase, partial [Pirellulales bacterium]